MGKEKRLMKLNKPYILTMKTNLTRKEIEETIDKVFKDMDVAKRDSVIDWRYISPKLQREISDSLKKEFSNKPIRTPYSG